MSTSRGCNTAFFWIRVAGARALVHEDFCGVGARNCEQEEKDGGLAHYQTHHHGPLLTVASTSADAVKQLPNMLH